MIKHTFNYFGYNISNITMQDTFQNIYKCIKKNNFNKFSMSDFIDITISTYQRVYNRKNNG